MNKIRSSVLVVTGNVKQELNEQRSRAGVLVDIWCVMAQECDVESCE